MKTKQEFAGWRARGEWHSREGRSWGPLEDVLDVFGIVRLCVGPGRVCVYQGS